MNEKGLSLNRTLAFKRLSSCLHRIQWVFSFLYGQHQLALGAKVGGVLAFYPTLQDSIALVCKEVRLLVLHLEEEFHTEN